jgi:hypothetical protein
MNCRSGLKFCIFVGLLGAVCHNASAGDPPPPWQLSSDEQYWTRVAEESKQVKQTAATEPLTATGNGAQLDDVLPAQRLPTEGIGIPRNAANNNSANMNHWQDPWDIGDDEAERSPLGFQEGLFSHMFRDGIRDRFWMDTDLLFWVARGTATPALLTSSPVGTSAAQAGVIGQSGTQVVQGGSELDSSLRTGVRLELGGWLNADHTVALETVYLSLGHSTADYDATSGGIPLLARPYFNTATGANSAILIAYPGQSSADFQTHVDSDFQSFEFLWRRMLASSDVGRLDLLFGYRYQQLDEQLSVNDDFTATGTGGRATVGTTSATHDEFDTRDDFNGLELGVASQVHYNRWSLDNSLKLAVGDVYSVAAIGGSRVIDVPGSATVTDNHGFLALPNLGIYRRDNLSIVPEISTSLGWQITSSLKMKLGYTFSYWTNVARPGEEITTTSLNPAQISSVNATTGGPFHVHTTDYWAQGGNLGFEYKF